MNNTYTDLVKQTFDFPQEGFTVDDNNLFFNGLDVRALIDKYGTPFKLTFLPKIGMQINKAKKIKVTNKDTGRSVTVSRQLSRKEIHELAELVK